MLRKAAIILAIFATPAQAEEWKFKRFGGECFLSSDALHGTEIVFAKNANDPQMFSIFLINESWSLSSGEIYDYTLKYHLLPYVSSGTVGRLPDEQRPSNIDISANAVNIGDGAGYALKVYLDDSYLKQLAELGNFGLRISFEANGLPLTGVLRIPSYTKQQLEICRDPFAK